MDQLPQSLPDIIASAAQSPLGILALAIIVLGGIAFYFFKNASTRAKGVIFASLLIGTALLGYVVVGQKMPTSGDSDQPRTGQASPPKPVPEPLPQPQPVVIDIPVETRGGVVSVVARHHHVPGENTPGELVLSYRKTTPRSPITIVVEGTDGRDVWTSPQIDHSAPSLTHRMPLDGLTGRRVKVYRWAPGAFGIPGSGGGEALLTLPRAGDVRLDIVVTD